MKTVYALVFKGTMSVPTLPMIGTLAICLTKKEAKRLLAQNSSHELEVIGVNIIKA